jgi:hypothetical protein
MKKLVYFIIIFAMLLSIASCGHKIDGSSVEDMDPSENDVIEDENMIAVSESEAKENGGFYILSDNLFYPLQKGGNIGNLSQTNNNLLFTDENSEFIPKLKKGEKLVLFSDDDVADHYMALPVIEIGFTIPAYFSEPTDQWGNTSCKVIGQTVKIENYVQQAEEQSMEKLEVESISGMGYAEFFNNNTFHSNKFCSKETDSVIGDGCYGTDDKILMKAPKGKEIEFSYHQGTAYQNNIIPANIKYYAFDGCKKDCDYGTFQEDYTGVRMEVSLTDKSYAELDITDLESGFYIVPLDSLRGNGSSREYDRFIFEVQ